MSLVLKGYTLVNDEKVNRAIFGTVGREGKLTGGVGEKAADEVKLAEYDRLGGLILKGTHKVKMGSFWDFEKKIARAVKKVELVFRDIEGKEVVIPEDQDLPIEVKAAQAVEESKKIKKVKKEVKEDEE